MLLVCLTLYGLALAAPPPFEEASLRLAERLDAFRTEGWAGFRRATKRAQRGHKVVKMERNHAVPFQLAPIGSPLMALTWKNLIGLGRLNTPRNFLLCLGGVLLLGGAVSQAFPVGSPVPQIAAGILAYGALLAIIVTIQQRRHDLRLDIPHFPNLRAYPLTARQVLHGEVLGIAAVVSAYTVLALAACASLLAGVGTVEEWIPLPWYVRASGLARCQRLRSWAWCTSWSRPATSSPWCGLAGLKSATSRKSASRRWATTCSECSCA